MNNLFRPQNVYKRYNNNKIHLSIVFQLQSVGLQEISGRIMKITPIQIIYAFNTPRDVKTVIMQDSQGTCFNIQLWGCLINAFHKHKYYAISHLKPRVSMANSQTPHYTVTPRSTVHEIHNQSSPLLYKTIDEQDTAPECFLYVIKAKIINARLRYKAPYGREQFGALTISSVDCKDVLKLYITPATIATYVQKHNLQYNLDGIAVHMTDVDKTFSFSYTQERIINSLDLVD